LSRARLHHRCRLRERRRVRLDLGPWERVFDAEFDGRRRKRVVLKAIGE